MIQDNLIFDIGFHKGLDAAFFVAKGFNVIGLEAREDLSEIVREKYADIVESGKLKIVCRALHDDSNTSVSFFINDEKDDWGSLHGGGARS